MSEVHFYQEDNKRLLMGVYNAARKAANNDTTYKGRVIEIGRVNRAFGILQSKEYDTDYHMQTWKTECNCPDATYRPEFICKHQLAAMMQEKIDRLESEAIYQAASFDWEKVEFVETEVRQSRQDVLLKELGF